MQQLWGKDNITDGGIDYFQLKYVDPRTNGVNNKFCRGDTKVPVGNVCTDL